MYTANLVLKSRTSECLVCGETRPTTLFDMCPICYRKQQILAMPDDEREFTISQTIPSLFQSARIENLSESLQAAIKLLEVQSNGKGLFIWGSPGTGKSYALAAMSREYILQGFIVARVTYEMLCLKIRDSFKTNNQTELSIIKPYLDADKFILEDVGTTKSEGNKESDFSVRTLLVLIDYRLENCLPTFISSNRPIEELAKTFDERISSRLVQACKIIKLTGKDRRKEK